MLEHGAHVVLVDIDDGRLAQARETLGTARIATWQSAIDTPESCAAAIESAGAPVAALIHLAGLFERDPFDSGNHGVWDRAIAANLTNAYDLAVAFATRFELILAMDTDPKLVGPNADRMAEERQYLRNDAVEAITAFRRRREENVDFLRKLAPAQWDKGGTHPVRGRMTIDTFLTLMAWHDDNHLDQLKRALDGKA